MNFESWVILCTGLHQLEIVISQRPLRARRRLIHEPILPHEVPVSHSCVLNFLIGSKSLYSTERWLRQVIINNNRWHSDDLATTIGCIIIRAKHRLNWNGLAAGLRDDAGVLRSAMRVSFLFVVRYIALLLVVPELIDTFIEVRIHIVVRLRWLKLWRGCQNIFTSRLCDLGL